MRWMKLEPIIQSEVSQKDKDHDNEFFKIRGLIFFFISPLPSKVPETLPNYTDTHAHKIYIYTLYYIAYIIYMYTLCYI